MASPFAFIPRKVAKSAKAQVPLTNVGYSSNGSTATGPSVHPQSTNSQLTVTSKDNGKGKEKAVSTSAKSLPSEDYAIVVCLALSDHALWLDPDLRRAVEQHPDVTERFIPLGYLLRHSSVLKLAGLGQHVRIEEAVIVKALRTHANEILEVRMLVDGSSSGWQAKDRGLYEVRRKDWEDMPQQPSRGYTRDDWERRTVYLENIPIMYRTVSAIARLTSGLLSRPGQALSMTKVQNIALPPHHQDRPGDQPKCKGFALVTLADQQDVQPFLDEWPWDGQTAHAKSSSTNEEYVRESVKFGLRTLSKSRWDQLKDEYLAYQRQLLDELVAFNDGTSDKRPYNDIHPSEHDEEYETPSQPEPEPPEPANMATTTLASPYPLNCLVFVRNIHPETNKTTLRKLFSIAFGATSAESLDYVDFNKGMDSCYLRLGSPHQAQVLVDHFASHLIAQDRGLDDSGNTFPANKCAGVITMEIVQGKREELYWDKVPEKVRKQAVQKAVRAQLQSNANGDIHMGSQLVAEDGATGTKRRKRKRDM